MQPISERLIAYSQTAKLTRRAPLERAVNISSANAFEDDRPKDVCLEIATTT